MSDSGLDAAQQIADMFMARKGYKNAKVIAVENDHPEEWMFTYDLPDGEVDLVVQWVDNSWDAYVSDFLADK